MPLIPIDEQLLTIAIDQARAFIQPMLESEDEGIRLCAGSVKKAIDGLLKKAAIARADGIEQMRQLAGYIAIHGCLEPPDGGSPTEDEHDLCRRIARQIYDAKPHNS